MTSDLPPPKRRRLDAASTLSKPFKTPLRKPTATGASASPQHSPQTPETTRASNDEAHLTVVRPVSKTSKGSFSSSPSTSPISHLRQPIPTRSVLSTPTRDPEALNLQRQQRTLRARLASLRAELDTANQALRIESSTKDSELEALVIKWRHASQEAAVEVFEGAQERVKRMGGMAAWRECSKRDTSRWDLENENHAREDEGEGEEQPVYSEDKDETQNAEEREEVRRRTFPHSEGIFWANISLLSRSLLWAIC